MTFYSPLHWTYGTSWPSTHPYTGHMVRHDLPLTLTLDIWYLPLTLTLDIWYVMTFHSPLQWPYGTSWPSTHLYSGHMACSWHILHQTSEATAFLCHQEWQRMSFLQFYHEQNKYLQVFVLVLSQKHYQLNHTVWEQEDLKVVMMGPLNITGFNRL